MKQFLFVILLLVASHFLLAQKVAVNEFAGIDKTALQIPDTMTKGTDAIASYIVTHFKTDHEKARAAFIWVASNIQYDIANMFALNFYEKQEEKISKPLRERRGICENYAALFTDICKKSGMKSYIVEGYTKQNGFADYIPHAWSATQIEGRWFLFDPTWGSGYVNGRKFYKKINNNYFQAEPAVFIKSHMPFDFMWQFLPYPVTNQEFYEGKTQADKSKSYFDFNDSIRVHFTKDSMEQLIAIAHRIEKNGMKNSMIFDRFHHLKSEIEMGKQSKVISLYNSAGADFNTGIHSFNEFINFRNKQFVPKKSDPEIQQMLDTVAHSFQNASMKLSQIAPFTEEQTKSVNHLKKSIEEADIQFKEQQTWLKEYLSKGKAGRKSMFYKVSWFGIPIN
jgi:hypothetical protein